MLIYSYSVFGQQASKQQIAMLNELSNKFDYVTDDFYPENNRYVPKGISVLGIEWKAFYPVINKDGTIYFVAFYRGRGWLFVDKIAVKINDEIFNAIHFFIDWLELPHQCTIHLFSNQSFRNNSR